MKIKFKMYFLLSLLISLTSSCSLGPDYVSPKMEVASGWKNQEPITCDAIEVDQNGEFVYLDDWWQVFEDQKLEELEQLAVQNNRDIFMAYERVKEAQAVVGIQSAAFYPQATLNPVFSNTVELIRNYRNPNLIASTPPFRSHEVFYALPLNLSYEVDLWGKIRDRYNASIYAWRAQQKDYEAVMLGVTSNVAIAYYQLRSLDSELDLLTTVLASRQKAFTINKDRYDEQITLYADVALAGEQLESAKSQYEETLRLRKNMENAIALLIGVEASQFCMEHLPLSGSPPCIPGGIPSHMLLRRPDIAEAEFLVRSQHATVKEAYTAFFPDITLTATPGFISPIAGEFMKWISRYWTNQTEIDQVVFDGGRVSSNFRLQIARFKETSYAYQQQVLIAFRDVENALNDMSAYKKQYEITEQTVKWAKKAYTLYYDRFKLGVIYYIDVVNTEQTLLNQQISLNALQGLRFVATVQFIRALGGGWDLPNDGITENTCCNKL